MFCLKVYIFVESSVRHKVLGKIDVLGSIYACGTLECRGQCVWVAVTRSGFIPFTASLLMPLGKGRAVGDMSTELLNGRHRAAYPVGLALTVNGTWRPATLTQRFQYVV
jgi:hypothetical protein